MPPLAVRVVPVTCVYGYLQKSERHALLALERAAQMVLAQVGACLELDHLLLEGCLGNLAVSLALIHGVNEVLYKLMPLILEASSEHVCHLLKGAGVTCFV